MRAHRETPRGSIAVDRTMKHFCFSSVGVDGQDIETSNRIAKGGVKPVAAGNFAGANCARELRANAPIAADRDKGS
jgi:hypothetical protein